MKNIRWVVLAILVFASAIAYLLRTNFNIVSETIMHDLGMNEYQLGMVFWVFAAIGALLWLFIRADEPMIG